MKNAVAVIKPLTLLAFIPFKLCVIRLEVVVFDWWETRSGVGLLCTWRFLCCAKCKSESPHQEGLTTGSQTAKGNWTWSRLFREM